MADKKFNLVFDASMDVAKMKSSLEEIQKQMNGLKMPQNVTKSLINTFEQLSQEIESFNRATAKGIGSKTDLNKLEKSSEKILNLWVKLKGSYENLSNMSNKQLEKLFPEQISQNIKKANDALNTYKSQIESATSELKNATKAADELQTKISKENNKKIVSSESFKQLSKDIHAAENEIDKFKKQLDEVNNKINNKKAEYPTTYKKSSVYREAIKELEEYKTKLNEANERLQGLLKTQNETTTNESHAKALAELNSKYEEAVNKVKNLQDQLGQLKNVEKNQPLSQLIEQIGTLLNLDMSKFTKDAEGLGNAIQTYVNQQLQQFRNNLEQTRQPLNNMGEAAHGAEEKIRDAGYALQEFDQRSKEVSALKARITAFFGLNNAIQLTRRTLRSAYNTVKELDKAMTETAVVTDFTVSDMWSQLPEYTKRANELGVTTLAAYEASTLFYQQGLKTNEVVALSNETLKMARIAGLDAAEATDRMTNALRGFQMALTETNAQRVDDVYSKLAAITASNVDEISTAMTKVASLANNANMEFETTAAFLAQIIETTRESAETAGTALKTVVARFSEVKALYTKEELTGTDEEGEIIDVNKIGKALRTAGIDLNKYFLGQVGLDEIFMELAEKWDSLTSVQQRYIATQAAGSRQQSRFIALMSDYARTQELVSAAYNANGAAAEQFEKTQDSLQSKLARLKNAWDEFTMGLANNALIKTGVDLLTGVLNVVNKLTSGFGLLRGNVGSFINALLKIGTVAGVRSLVKGPASMLINSIGSMIGIGGVSNKEAYLRGVFRNDNDAIGNLQNQSWGSILRYQYGGIFNNINQKRSNIANAFNNVTALGYVGENAQNIGLLGNLGYKIGTSTKLGQGLAGGSFASSLSKLLGYGTSAGGATAAAGVATLGIAIAGVTVAAVGAYGVIKQLYDASPAGQLKQAEKLRDEIDYTRQSLEATRKTVNETLTTYEEQLETLKNATYGTREWANAFNDVNTTVTDLITKFPQLMQYVTYTADGLLQLSEEGLAQYQKTLDDQIKSYNALSILSTGNIAQKKAATLTGIDKTAQERIAEASYTAGLASMFGDKFGEDVYKAFSKSFDFSKWAKQAGKSAGSGTGGFLGIGSNIWTTKNELRKQYKELTGQEADEGWNANQISDAIGQFQSLPKIEEELQQIYDIIQKLTPEQAGIVEGRTDLNVDDYKELLKNTIYNGIDFSTFLNKPDIVNELINNSFDNSSQQLVDSLLAIVEKYRGNLTNEELYQEFGVSSLEFVGVELYKQLIEIIEEQKRVTENVNKIFSEGFTSSYSNALKDTLEKITGGITKAGAEEYYNVAEVLKSLALSGIDVTKAFSTLNLKTEEQKEAFSSILGSIDTEDPNTITMAIRALDDMGITINEDTVIALRALAFSANDAANALATADEATKKFKFARELEDREDFTFTADEYNQLAGIDDDNFYRVSEDLYVYLGENFKTLIDGLVDVGEKTLNKSVQSIDAKITQTEKELFDKQQVQSLLDKGWSIESIADTRNSAFASSNESYFGYNYSQRLSYLQDLFFRDLEQELKDLNKNRKTLSQGSKFYTSTQQLSIYDDKDAIRAQYQANKEAQKYSKEIKKQIDLLSQEKDITKDIITNEEEKQALIQKTSLEYQQTIEKYSKLKDTISDNSDALSLDSDSQYYKKAVENVATAISEMYGISEQAARTFVEENSETIATAMDNEEDFVEFLSSIGQIWINEEKERINNLVDIDEEAKQILIDNLDFVAQQLQDLPQGKIDFDIKTAEALQTLQNFGVDVNKFMESMGFELIASPGGTISIPNPAYAAMAGIPAPGGGNMADAANIPKETTVISSRFIWKRIGQADVTPKSPGGGGGSTSSPSEPEEITNKRSEISYAKQALSTMEAEGRPDEELQKQRDKIAELIQDLIDLLRKNGGIDVLNPNNPDYEQDTEEILSLFAEKFSYYLKEEIESELPAQISNEKSKLSLMEAQGKSAEELNAQRRIIQELLHEYAEELRKALPEGAEDTEEIRALSIEWWGLQNDILNSLDDVAEELSNVWENLDRYYNINGLVDRLVQTGNDLNETLQEQMNNPTSITDVATTMGLLLQNYGQQMSAYLYKQGALESDRERLLNSSKYADIFAQGLLQVLDSGDLIFNWEAIDELEGTETELYELVEEFESKYDDNRKQLLDVNNSIKSVNSSVDSFKNTYNTFRSAYIDLQKKLTDALISNEREAINQEKEYYQELNDTNNAILDSMREQINLQRQIRDNTKTEKEIWDLQTKLAYLQRDTTGSNAQEILKLEKELQEKQQNYQDKLVDQELSRLQQQNKEEQKNNDNYINYLTKRLDNLIETGEFSARAEEIISGSIDEEGKLLSNSLLEKILKEDANWDALTEAEKEVFMEDLEDQALMAAGYLYMKEGSFFSQLIGKDGLGGFFGSDSDFATFLASNKDVSFKTLLDEIKNDFVQAIEGIDFSYNVPSLDYLDDDEDISKEEQPEPWEGIPMDYSFVTGTLFEGWREAQDQGTSVKDFLIGRLMELYSEIDEGQARKYINKLGELMDLSHFSTGGLTYSTGLAWLDGTPSRPEYVLNPDQTQAFLKLAEILPAFVSGNTSNSVKNAENIYLYLTMNVDEIGNDYDVDRIVERVKEKIYDAGTYRNVNILDFS